MSSIESIEAISEYAPIQRDMDREEVDAAPHVANENVEVPKVQAAAENQDTKTTVQGFQYTGKGTLFDGAV